ncbi:hypothetical protein ACIBHY_36305 [Nonomuraea sp. NPDC050547]
MKMPQRSARSIPANSTFFDAIHEPVDRPMDAKPADRSEIV